MVDITIASNGKFEHDEHFILAQLLRYMCTSPECHPDNPSQISILNRDVTCTIKSVNEDGEVSTHMIPMSRDAFVELIHKAQNAEFRLTVDTADGKKTITQPYFPVTLMDIPAIKCACITLDAMPDFFPVLHDQNIHYKLAGEMAVLAEQNIDT